MACRPFRLGDASGFVCGSRAQVKPCTFPGCHRPHTKLCDWPLSGTKAGATCDAKLCDRHATSAGPGRDFCPPHAAQAKREGSP